jgi:hypothetical protein
MGQLARRGSWRLQFRFCVDEATISNRGAIRKRARPFPSTCLTATISAFSPSVSRTRASASSAEEASNFKSGCRLSTLLGKTLRPKWQGFACFISTPQPSIELRHTHKTLHFKETTMADIPHSILVVDDDPLILVAISETLMAEGLSITTSNNPLEALELIKKNPYAVVMSDQRMGEMTAWNYFRKSKSSSPIPREFCSRES